ncbi:hypothetical protein O6H91_10G079200 [Diphasiastrum complanatum]|uniref:Uncharacterized protein n=1 Tax=Diphasiastrum complanatum TaxID=34168 RepID=A0ACC2CIJ8_DIPCM|nr:hypothetical protein O6H91_10G079200 [Diphasiastrum complanatum]
MTYLYVGKSVEYKCYIIISYKSFLSRPGTRALPALDPSRSCIGPPTHARCRRRTPGAARPWALDPWHRIASCTRTSDTGPLAQHGQASALPALEPSHSCVAGARSLPTPDPCRSSARHARVACVGTLAQHGQACARCQCWTPGVRASQTPAPPTRGRSWTPGTARPGARALPALDTM